MDSFFCFFEYTVNVNVYAPLKLELSLWELLSVVSKLYLEYEREKVRKKYDLAKAAAETVNSAGGSGGGGGNSNSSGGTSPSTNIRRKSSITTLGFEGLLDASNHDASKELDNSPAMKNAKKSILNIQSIMSTSLELVNEIKLSLSAIAAGGDGGVLGIKLENLDANLYLPKNPFQGKIFFDTFDYLYS